MANVQLDMRDLERLTRDLRKAASGALPFAARNALNTIAFEGRRVWAGKIERQFVLRNKFTVRSTRVVKAKLQRDVDRMEAELGSVAPYMRLQEFGGVERGRSRSKPVPTTVAAGQGMGVRPRTRPVRRPNRLNAIRLARSRQRGSNRSQRNVVAVKQAAATGRKFALLDLNRGKALVMVTGRKRLNVRMVWDLSRRSVRVPASPTLQPTLDALGPRVPGIHAAAIVEQLRRHKVLGY